MPNTCEGMINASGMKCAIVAARFNEFVVAPLISGAVDTLIRCGAQDGDISVYRCPGAYELPQLLKWVVDKGGVDAVICLGAVIRGATPHFAYVAGEVSKGVASVALDAGIPITFGVITTDTIEQAIERCGTKAGNKGADAAMAAIEMASLRETHFKGK